MKNSIVLVKISNDFAPKVYQTKCGQFYIEHVAFTGAKYLIVEKETNNYIAYAKSLRSVKSKITKYLIDKRRE